MSEIKNKIALVTGGASGIGKLIGQKLLEKGLKALIIWDINPENLDKSTKEFRSKGYTIYSYLVDVSDNESIILLAKKIQDEIGMIDILVNNAGIVVGKNFHEHTHKDIDLTMSINSNALMHITLEFINNMIKNNSGHIVNIASAAGLVPNPKMSVYCASKWAVIGWSESLRIELEKLKKDLHVTTVTPYYINTGMFDGVQSHFLLPILKQEKVATKIVDAVIKNKILVRLPFLIKTTPFFRGFLPARFFDLIVGKFLKVYNTMDNFKGRGN